MTDEPEDLTATDDASTPLAEDERPGLIPTWIAYRSELNEAEQANIVRAAVWAHQYIRRAKSDILSDRFVRDLHRRMLGNVWRWAGTFRSTERNIGVAPYQISSDLRNLLDDAKAWIEFSAYPPDEILARFHHRLVAIHPFPNGNGRHGRLMTDLLAVKLGVKPLTWGGASLTSTTELRRLYIEALRHADIGQYEPLVLFLRM